MLIKNMSAEQIKIELITIAQGMNISPHVMENCDVSKDYNVYLDRLMVNLRTYIAGESVHRQTIRYLTPTRWNLFKAAVLPDSYKKKHGVLKYTEQGLEEISCYPDLPVPKHQGKHFFIHRMVNTSVGE